MHYIRNNMRNESCHEFYCKMQICENIANFYILKVKMDAKIKSKHWKKNICEFSRKNRPFCLLSVVLLNSVYYLCDVI